MGNHLRELIDDVERREVMIPDGVSFATEKMVLTDFLIKSESAICFDCGSFLSMDGIRVVSELANPPFETTWLEFSIPEQFNGGGITGILVGDMHPGICGYVFTRKNHQWIFQLWFSADGEKIKASGDAVQFKINEFSQNVVVAVRAFFTALHCENVLRKESRPEQKIQKARARRGKKPLFSYWTLELQSSRVEGDECGGTHSSPRLHLRRGHPRQYVKGKWTWVQPCLVGNKSLGMIHKDYSMNV